MRLGIMQPYFLPYIGYYSLIAATDEWVVFDTPQYIRKGWVNRNRVLKKNGGTKYISVPTVKAAQQTPINEILISDGNWKNEIIRNLDYYKEVKAPHYEEVVDMVISIPEPDSGLLVDALISSLETSCRYLGISREFKVFSTLDIDTSQVKGPGDWALVISEQLNADTYINPPGGKAIFNEQKFQDKSIALKFLEHELPPYDQKSGHFEPGLSILDVIMFNPVSKVQDMLECYNLS